MFKYNPQNGLKATTSVRHFVSASMVNIALHLLFLNQSRVAKLVYTNYYKIIWIVRVFWLVYKCVFIAPWSTKLTWAMWFDCPELWDLTVSWKKLRYTYALRIMSFSLLKNNNFLKELKHVLHAFGKVCLGFHQAMKARRTRFISWILHASDYETNP